MPESWEIQNTKAVKRGILAFWHGGCAAVSDVKPCDGGTDPARRFASRSRLRCSAVGGVRGPPLVGDMACWGGGMTKGSRTGTLFYAMWRMDKYKNVPQPQGHPYVCTLYGSKRTVPGQTLL